MPDVIRNRSLEPDSYLRVESLEGVAQDADLLVPLAVLTAQREALQTRPGKLGVWLETTDEPGEVAPYLPMLDLVAVHFSSFADGRGHSIARLLRERHGFRGEIRAVGDVFKETLFYLSRCGFDAFVLRPGERVEEALKGLDVFSEAYQASVERPSPLFRRRLAVPRGEGSL
ncbi:MAG: DUF934 domain-containing protein [Betaproteobacteria bacterium]|nr:DUF934 domain-containing protein [Betaproteobacteria bacterium]MDE2622269.1 DUF934 domain-containing protein [Betaproteobacteria bacterium]